MNRQDGKISNGDDRVEVGKAVRTDLWGEPIKSDSHLLLILEISDLASAVLRHIGLGNIRFDRFAGLFPHSEFRRLAERDDVIAADRPDLGPIAAQSVHVCFVDSQPTSTNQMERRNTRTLPLGEDRPAPTDQKLQRRTLMRSVNCYETRRRSKAAHLPWPRQSFA